MRFKFFIEGFTTLYRGDSSDYKIHSLSKGDHNALFGQGIYLTNSKRIAGDYTVKGNQDVIFRCSGCRTKQSVVEAFIRVKAQQFDDNGVENYYTTSLPPMVDDPIRIKRLGYARDYWEKIKKDYEIRINVDGTGSIVKKLTGHVSIYEIPNEIIEKTYNTEEEIDDHVLNALCAAARSEGWSCRDIQNISLEDEDGFKTSFRKIWQFLSDSGWGVANNKRFQTNFRREMKNLGYTGLFYSGGVTMGGGNRHNAYVFWDEQGIKKYRKK